MSGETGEFFQKETKYIRGKLQDGALEWSSKPDMYKEYSDSDKVELPGPESKDRTSLDDCLKRRKSVRSYSEESVSQEQLLYLLWAAAGIQRRERGHEYRTAPSAGALYPIETYLIVNNVEKLEKGLYHYNVKMHALEALRLEDLAEEIVSAALGQEMCSDAAVVFVWTAVFNRSKWKYGQRAFRYVYVDVGHMGQNLALAAASMRLGSCQVGAFFDDEVNGIIDVDGIEESSVYMSVVGHPRQTS
jgi:SagB-type dehydrogenase family enzyme